MISSVENRENSSSNLAGIISLKQITKLGDLRQNLLVATCPMCLTVGCSLPAHDRAMLFQHALAQDEQQC
jgi:hypothetical protein